MKVSDPADADPRPFGCWICGKVMLQVGLSKTRECLQCDVRELRHLTEYIPRVRTEKSLVTKDWTIPYLDHSTGHYPSPA